MFAKIKQKYATAKPATRKMLMITLVTGVVVVIASAVFFAAPSHNQQPIQPTLPKGNTLNLDSSLASKSTASQLDAQQKDIDNLKKQAQNFGAGMPSQANNQAGAGALPGTSGLQQTNPLAPLPPIAGPQTAAQKEPVKGVPGYNSPNKQKDLPPIPQPPQGLDQNAPRSYPQPPGAGRGNVAVPKEEILGGIGYARNKDIVASTEKTDDGKKKGQHVYLPPSFMEAHLLSGLNAPVSSGGKSNPVPVIIRVAAPAQLPNEVKMGLKGCFVIAEGVGDLSQERALCRLVSLSCLSKNGNAVIDQQITGFVQDSDAKPGLAGNVVAKFGSKIARTFLAGVASGIGSAAVSSSGTNSFSALGVAQTMTGTNLQDIGVAGIGSGISKAGEQIEKFYMDLANQSMPVIEVGSGKKITVIITKGVNLEIKNFPTVSWF